MASVLQVFPNYPDTIAIKTEGKSVKQKILFKIKRKRVLHRMVGHGKPKNKQEVNENDGRTERNSETTAASTKAT